MTTIPEWQLNRNLRILNLDSWRRHYGAYARDAVLSPVWPLPPHEGLYVRERLRRLAQNIHGTDFAHTYKFLDMYDQLSIFPYVPCDDPSYDKVDSNPYSVQMPNPHFFDSLHLKVQTFLVSHTRDESPSMTFVSSQEALELYRYHYRDRKRERRDFWDSRNRKTGSPAERTDRYWRKRYSWNPDAEEKEEKESVLSDLSALTETDQETGSDSDSDISVSSFSFPDMSFISADMVAYTSFDSLCLSLIL